MSAPIELNEYADSDLTEISAGELEALSKLLPNLVIRPAGDDLYVLNPGGVVGAGEIGDRRVTVHPKIGMSRLMFLIAYSLDPVRWQETVPELAEAPDLVESVVPAFVAAVRKAAIRGVLRGYQGRADALMTIRGRIDFDVLIKRRFGVVPPIDCQFDEYTADIELNRLLFAASNRLLRLKRLNERWRTSLHSLRSLFWEVSPARYSPHRVPTINYTRLTRHYRPAVELARLILRNFTVDFGPHEVRARGFFVDMARIFEDFVVIALREALGLSVREFPQEAEGRKLSLARGPRIKLEPDLSWWDGGRCIFIGDVKYKKTPSTTGVKHPDLYQLLAYAQATDLGHGLLVYAAGPEVGGGEYAIVNSDKILRVRTLDLAHEPVAVLGDIDEIAREIRATTVGNLRPARALAPV